MTDVPHISPLDQARILSEALPHMQEYDEETIVIKYGGHAAATASVSQLTIRSVPPVGAANGNRLCPAYWRSVRSPANKAAATTNPNAAAIPIRG